jgi:hypothetical protein
MKKKTKKESGALLRASVTKEMAKPRMAKSVREVEMNLATARIGRGNLRKYKLRPLLLALPHGACS